MNQNDWLAAAEDCLINAQRSQENGDTDRAAWWRRNAAAMKKAAQQAEQEQQHEQPEPVS